MKGKQKPLIFVRDSEIDWDVRKNRVLTISDPQDKSVAASYWDKKRRLSPCENLLAVWSYVSWSIERFDIVIAHLPQTPAQ